MRPVRLELEGFTAFRTPRWSTSPAPTCSPWSGRPGPARSSIIDALTFALYGRVPRLDDRRAVAPVISQNLTEARVRLDFTVDGEAYTAVRVVRATKAGAPPPRRPGSSAAPRCWPARPTRSPRRSPPAWASPTSTSSPACRCPRASSPASSTTSPRTARTCWCGCSTSASTTGWRRRPPAGRRGPHPATLAAGQLDELAGATPEARADAADRVEALAALGEHLAAERPAIDELAATAAAEQAEADEVAPWPAARRPGAARWADELAAALATAAAAKARCAERGRGGRGRGGRGRGPRLGPARGALEAQRQDHGLLTELGQVASGARPPGGRGAAEVGGRRRGRGRGRGRPGRAAAAPGAGAGRAAGPGALAELAVGHPCPVCGQEVAALPVTSSADLRLAERAWPTPARPVDEATRSARRGAAEQARVDEKLARVRGTWPGGRPAGGRPDRGRPRRAAGDRRRGPGRLDKARQAERDARKAPAPPSGPTRSWPSGRPRPGGPSTPPATRWPPWARRRPSGRDLAADWGRWWRGPPRRRRWPRQAAPAPRPRRPRPRAATPGRVLRPPASGVGGRAGRGVAGRGGGRGPRPGRGRPGPTWTSSWRRVERLRAEQRRPPSSRRWPTRWPATWRPTGSRSGCWTRRSQQLVAGASASWRS